MWNTEILNYGIWKYRKCTVNMFGKQLGRRNPLLSSLTYSPVAFAFILCGNANICLLGSSFAVEMPFCIGEVQLVMMTWEEITDQFWFKWTNALSTTALGNGNEARIATNRTRLGYLQFPVTVFASLMSFQYPLHVIPGFTSLSNTCWRSSLSNLLVSRHSPRYGSFSEILVEERVESEQRHLPVEYIAYIVRISASV